MQINLSSGMYSIVSSGQTFLFNLDENLKIDIIADNNSHFSIILEFRQDSCDDQKIDSKSDGNIITLTCFNFDDKGTGLAKPINIAQIDGKDVFLMFWSYAEGEEERKVRSVKYTIFMNNNVGENVDER
ncbi:MAG: hypothetical protein J6B68_09645 [Lachnospiraceae bacterium]|nr:hypothetical protein [Lachnospiraceae bacterium]